MLVSLPQDSTLAIPSKLYEYMRFPARLLALSDPNSASAKLLAGTDADVVDPSDVDAIAERFRRRYLEFAAGVRPVPLAADRRFSREHQAQLLLDGLDQLSPP